MASDFLARIRLALEGQEKVISGLTETQTKMEEVAGTQISFPWMEKIYPTIRKGVGTTKEFEKSFKNLGDETRRSFQSMGDFEKALRRVLIVAPVWMAFRAIMQGTMRLISEQVKFLKDLEDAMARIRIVGKGTEEQYQNLRTSLVALSMAYGTVASAATEAAVIFAQQGKTVEEVTKLTRIAMIASQVLGADMKTTVENLTAAINAFNIPSEDAINIVDKLINVEKNFAVTSANLADAIKVTGATANQMGVSIDALMGHVTAVIEVTRKSGSEASRGLQFIYARLLTTGRDVIQQIARIPIHLDNQNKATFALTNTYRSATDVLDDLANKWDSLTNKEKLAIAQNVASKRQLTVFMALMQNYNASLNARIIALSAAGKAEEAFSIIQDTLTFKLNKLSASWNNLTISIGDTTVFKGAIDGITNLVNGISILINKYQALRNAIIKEKDDIEKNTETHVSQMQAISELIEMRNSYLTRIPTDKNKEMISKIESALQGLLKVSDIKIDIDDKDAISKLNEEISKIREFAITAKIEWDIQTEKIILEDKIKRLQESLKPSGFIIKDIIDTVKMTKHRQELKKLEKELSNLDKKRNDLIDERIAKYEAEKTNAEAKKSLIEDEFDLSDELTNAEEEKLNIQNQLNRAKALGILNSSQLVDLETKLIEKSLYSYDIHQKAVKLAELKRQKEEENLKLLVSQSDAIRNQYINYEKADMFERGRLRRLMELQKMTPAELGRAFEDEMYDRDLITQYWGSFSKEGQEAINNILQRLYDLPKLDLSTLLGGISYEAKAPTLNQQIIGANNININVQAGGMPTVEEMIDLINNMIENKLMTDESFVRTFARKIRPEM